MSFLLTCPICGERPAAEFGYAGTVGGDEGGATLDPLSEELYFSDNVAGEQLERWYHRYGCQRWMVVRRDTRTNAVSAVREGVE